MARPIGSKTKTDDQKAFVAAVEKALIKSGTYTNLANLVCRKLHSATPAESMPILMRLLEMRFGKPAQTTQLTGADGDALKIIIEHITA
jgi:hypothetical protein